MILKRTLQKPLWLVIISAPMLFGCSRSSTATPIEEHAPVPPATEAVSQPAPAADIQVLSAPKSEEVQEAVNRVFKSAVVIDHHKTPGFLVGDFNGDLSQDLAVILKPADGHLSELNQEFPNWIAREPLKEVLLPKSKVLSPVSSRSSNPALGQTIRFEQNDVLLAIIHGNGPKGWRDPEATQTHLLRDVVGTNMKTLPLRGAVNAFKGKRPFPTIYGDLIQQTLIGQSGFLHFTGGIYGWYDPKNYYPPPELVHARRIGMK
jgi:hypothetical protein